MRLPQPTAKGRALARELSRTARVSCDPDDLWAASRDCWPRALLWTKAGVAPYPPDVVAWPASAGEVEAIVALAAARQIPVVPIGGGSGVCGGAVPVQGGIALDLKRLSGAPRIDLGTRTVDVEAGLPGLRLEELLQAQGATLGHFPERRASTVGGWIATRSAGQCSSRYGKIEDMLLSLEAVDGTGAPLRTIDGPSAGPDLNQLFAGSEGTLGVITAARLRIWPKPTAQWLRAVRFPSMQQGLRALRAILKAGLRPSIARLLDPLTTLLEGRSVPVPAPLRWVVEAGQQEALRMALKAPLLLNRLVDALPASCLLLLGFESDSLAGQDDECGEEGDHALGLCQAAQGEDCGPAPGERGLRDRYGAADQKAKLFAAGAFADTLEVATTWDRVGSLERAVRHAVQGHAFVTALYAHPQLEGCAIEFGLVGLAGMTAAAAATASEDDNELDLEAAEARYDACTRAALSAVADEGATLSHHHGVGLARQQFLPRELGEGMQQLRALKRAFDPHGILNPGKLLP